MKRLILIGLVLSCIWPFQVSYAQVGIGIGTGGIGIGFGLGANRGRAANKLDKEVQYLKRELHLDKAQEAAVQELVYEREGRRDRKGRQARQDRFEEGMQEVLTPAQFDEYVKLRQGAPPSKKARKEKLPPSEWDDVYQ